MVEREELQDRLIEAALPHVAFDGWSQRSLAVAADDLGLEAAVARQAFPGGAATMVAQFVRLADRRMEADMAAAELSGLRVPARIRRAVVLRLDRWSGHREAVRRAVAVLALPSNLPLAARLGWETADAMWRAAGDAGDDLSRLTRRSTLAAVYTATLFYWLDDPSEGCVDTWAFLDRRLDEMAQLGRVRRGLKRGG